MTCILLNCIVKKLKNELAVRKLQNLALKWFNKHWLKFTGITPKKLHIPTSTMNVSIKKVIAPIKKILIHLNILSLVIMFIACGSDTVNNVTVPPVNNDLLTLDSVTAFIDLTPAMLVDSTVNFSNNDFDSLKISFTAETNATAVMQPYLLVAIQDTNGIIKDILVNDISNFNQDYTLYLKTHNINYSLFCRVKLSPLANLGTFVKIKNLHIVKVQ